MAVQISVRGEAGMVAGPGSLRKTAAEVSGGVSAVAGRRPASMLALKRGQVRRRVLRRSEAGDGGRGRACECCEGALELLRMPRMELRVLLFAGWRSSSEVLVFRGE